MVKFENDTVIYPLETAHFGTINYESPELVTMRDTVVYKEDTIGLKKLDEEGKLHLKEILGRDHCQIDVHDILTDFIPFLFEKDFGLDQ